MCQHAALGWMMIQVMRDIARHGEVPPPGREWLRERRLEPLGTLLPPLVKLVQASGTQNAGLADSADALPTATERILMNATACALRDPAQCEQLLAGLVPQTRVGTAEDLVCSAASLLQDYGCRRLRAAAARPRSRTVAFH